MDTSKSLDRRFFVRGAAALTAASVALGGGAMASPASASAQTKRTGRIRQSASRWCYGGMTLEELCRNVAALGGVGVDLLDENEWEVPAKFGLTCSMCNGPGGITKGWNRVEHHDELVKRAEPMLAKAAALKLPNLIVFTGNRDGQSEADGIKNCVTGLKRLTPLAEKLGVTLQLEYLNSRHDHGDYQFDHTSLGVEICKQVGSPRLKILYDLYHVQIMEGDLIARLRENKQWIGHYHTGGVPGRNEIDGTQEIHYPAVMKAIVETGFTGFVAHEFVPARDPLKSLGQAIELCDV
ncbi:MAG: TIM barrel protein [Planctomycetes bacterium]|nr:TIM barrel protein [Planctomycetota bacterium]